MKRPFSRAADSRSSCSMGRRPFRRWSMGTGTGAGRPHERELSLRRHGHVHLGHGQSAADLALSVPGCAGVSCIYETASPGLISVYLNSGLGIEGNYQPLRRLPASRSSR